MAKRKLCDGNADERRCDPRQQRNIIIGTLRIFGEPQPQQPETIKRS